YFGLLHGSSILENKNRCSEKEQILFFVFFKYYKNIFIFPLHAVLLPRKFFEHFLIGGEFYCLILSLAELSFYILFLLGNFMQLPPYLHLRNKIVGIKKSDIDQKAYKNQCITITQYFREPFRHG